MAEGEEQQASEQADIPQEPGEGELSEETSEEELNAAGGATTFNRF